MFGLVYKAHCKINGKCYVGQTTVGLKERRSNHIAEARRGYDGCPAFHRAIQKYGTENFEWFILQWCFSQDSLNEAERFWIEAFHSQADQNGYNIFVGGDNPSPEDIVRRGDAIRAFYKKGGKAWNCGIPTTEEAKKLLRIASSLHRHSSVTIEKLREKAKKRYEDSSRKFFGKNNPNYRNGKWTISSLAVAA